MASKKYEEYLCSEAWKKKRMQRLAIGKFRCAACGSKERLQVHHLTYAHIFDEPMEDLIPLCDLHHKAAEEMVEKGLLPRSEDVLFLATETIRLITGKMVSTGRIKLPNASKPVAVRNRIQQDLLADPAFVRLLNEPTRKAFKRASRRLFAGHAKRGRIMANAFALYDRHARVRIKPHMAPRITHLTELIMNHSADNNPF